MSESTGEKNETSACGCGGGSCCSGPGRWIWVVLLLAIAGVLVAKHAGRKNSPSAPPAPVATPVKALPRLVDLGAGRCIPCKMMTPVLKDLRTSYAGRMDVKFIDVWEKPDAGKEYGINLIPTQIFFSPDGKELFRHEGFFSKEEILAKWKELGVSFGT